MLKPLGGTKGLVACCDRCARVCEARCRGERMRGRALLSRVGVRF